MPRILPVDDIVSWPQEEGAIGVVGVAPWATIDFLKALYEQVKAEKDWQYPRVLCDINTKLPSRGRHLELGERDPSPFIAETIDELASQGATVVVVPCNTAHILYSSWAADASVEVLNIVRVSVAALGDVSGQVAVLASRSVYQNRLYEKVIVEAGLHCASLENDEIEFISRIIGAVKRFGRIPSCFYGDINKFFENLKSRNACALILGCTELTELAAFARKYFSCVVDSNSALAREALTKVGVIKL